MRRAAWTVAAFASALLLGGCGGPGERMTPVASPVASTDSSASPTGGEAAAPPSETLSVAPLPTGDAYADLARQLHARGVEVWFEADLVKRWQEGTSSFDQALDRLGSLGTLPGVRGFKVADELGYDDGISSVAEGEQFLQDVRVGLRARAPHAQVLIDVVVPELGCVGWITSGSQSCAESARTEHPAASIDAVGEYLRRGLVDRLDLSTGLLDEWTYRKWGLTAAVAQRTAWDHVHALGWSDHTVLQARKALAEPGGYRESPQAAASDVHTFVNIPTELGASAVDIWTWRQTYQGQTVSLLDDRLTTNALWSTLQRRHAAGVRLFTHMTPSMQPPGRAARARDDARVAELFDAVFVAAGTG